MKAKELGLFLLLAWLWGSSFLAISVAVHDYKPLEMVAARMVLGAFVLIIIMLLSGQRLNLSARGWVIAIVVGLSGNIIPFYLIGYAEQDVSSGLAALIMGIAPIITLVVAPLVHPEETLSRIRFFGALLGFSGVAVLFAPDLINGFSGAFVPKLALAGAALCYAMTALFSRRFIHTTPMKYAVASVVSGAFIACLLTLGDLDPSKITTSSLSANLALIYLGAGPTAMAAMIYFYLIPKIGATNLQQVNYIVPLLGTFLGIIFLGEVPLWNTWLAIPLIVSGVYMVSRKQKAAKVQALAKNIKKCA